MEKQDIKVLIFKIDDGYYACNIAEIEKILGCTKIAKVPDAPDYAIGIIENNDILIPIISLAKKFNLKTQEKFDESKIIVAKNNNKKIGLIVDEVFGVINIKKEEIENVPEIISSSSLKYIKGLIKLKNKIVIFLNLPYIFTKDK